MYAAVHAALATNRGLITAQQAYVAGLSDEQVRRLLRAGEWVAVRRGVYAEREQWESLDEHKGRPLFRARAAHMTMREDHVMSHNSAALELGMAFPTPPRELIHITRPDVRGSRTAYGVKHHGAVYREDQVTDRFGIAVLEAARTAVDIAREHGYRHGVVACDAARQLGVTPTELRRAYEPMRNWPRVREVRAAVADCDPGAETPGESLARLLVLELGIGRPVTQFPILIEGRTVFVDMIVGCHVVEFDGKVKYLGRDAGGVSTKSAEEVVWEEKRRQNLICAEGLGMSRLVWADLWRPARDRAAARILAEYAVTEARFGTSLPEHLRRFAQQNAGRRRIA